MLVDPPYRGLGPTLVSAVSVAVVGSTLLALAETMTSTWVTFLRLGEAPPFSLALVAFGRTALTHLLLWYPLMVLAACAVWALGRRSRRASRSDYSASRILTPIFLIVVSLLIVPSALGLIGSDSRVGLFVVRMLFIAAGIGVWFAVPLLRERLPVWNPRRWRNEALLVCAVSLSIGVAALLRSPFFDPGGFQVRTPAATVESTQQRPNVVWIVLDTVRADRMSVYGYDRLTTPFVEHLANEALVFENAEANAIWTVPSHASMFTGKSLREHGTDHDHVRLDDRFETVAEVLAGRGYETVSFSNNAWISKGTNLVQGFERSDVVGHLRQLPRMSLDVLLENFGITPPFSWLDSDSGAALTNDLIADWMEEREGDRPFLLFVNYMEAHLPYVVPIQARAGFLRGPEIHRSFDLRLSVYGHLPTVMGRYYDVQGPDVIDPGDRWILRRQYDAALRYLDRRVEELFGLIEQRGLLESTLVIVTSDHGEYLGQHDLWSHIFFPHRAVTRVPLILRPPGPRAGSRVQSPVQLSDLYSTILDGAVPGAVRVGGRNLLDLAGPGEVDDTDGSADAVPAVAEFGGPSALLAERIVELDPVRARYLLERQRSISDGRWRLIAGEAGTRKFYDLLDDPDEEIDLLATDGDARNVEARRLGAMLDEWITTTPIWQRPDGEAEVEESLIEAERRVLRALGYLN